MLKYKFHDKNAPKFARIFSQGELHLYTKLGSPAITFKPSFYIEIPTGRLKVKGLFVLWAFVQIPRKGLIS